MKFHSILPLVLGFCIPCHATPTYVDFDVTGIQSFGGQGNPGNQVFSRFLAADAHVVSIGWDVNVTASSPSWLSELGVLFSDSAAGGPDPLWLNPGAGHDLPGTASFAGFVNLVTAALDFSVEADGLLRLEFFESFDDPGVAPDGRWNFGTLTIGYEVGATGEPSGVPEPASLMLAGIALAGLATSRCRPRVPSRT